MATNNSNSNTSSTTSERMNINEALEALRQLQEEIMRHIGKEWLMDDNDAIKWIRSIERTLAYIEWMRQTLRDHIEYERKMYGRAYQPRRWRRYGSRFNKKAGKAW